LVTACKWGLIRIGDLCFKPFELGDRLGGLSSVSGTLGRIGDALDDFAEKHLKPREPRRDDENFDDCMNRVTDAPEVAGAGAAAVTAGARIVPYPRATPPGGGGTSVISTISRAIFGRDRRMGTTRIFGTNSVGGAIGRGLSRLSVLTGVAALGLAGGETIGAAQICRKN
jgi:hypothetical protein